MIITGRKNIVVPQGRNQQGFVLIVAMIMLLAVTIMVATGSNLVQSNLRVTQNMESREVARYAAIAAIEEAISSDRFTTSPDSIFSVSCEQDNRKCYDVNQDGNDDVFVTIPPPQCVVVTPIRNSELDVFGSPSEASCYIPGVYSLCANSQWEFLATATDPLTGASISVRQGVSVLTTINAIETACPS